MDEQELKALVKFGERRDVEIKGPGSVDDLLFLGRVARAALALSNHRDGGFIIIAAVQIAGSASFELSGMNAAQLARWRNKDVVLDNWGRTAHPKSSANSNTSRCTWVARRSGSSSSPGRP